MVVKPKTFVTDAEWQRAQHRQLLEMARDPAQAKLLIAKMDAHPDLRQGLWDVYCVAVEAVSKQAG